MSSLPVPPLQASEEGEEEKKNSYWQRFKSVVPFAGGDATLGKGLAKQVGNVTECALLSFLVDLGKFNISSCWVCYQLHTHTRQGFDYDAIRENYPTECFVKVFTFNSARKSMSTVVPLPGGGFRLFTKGASEIVLDKCSHIVAENGRVAPLSEVDKKDIVSSVVQNMASNALRTIGLAYR